MNVPILKRDKSRRPAAHQNAAAEREAVLLLHGSASSSAIWRRATQAMPSRYRIIAPDLIGYGQSFIWPVEFSYNVGAEIRALESQPLYCAHQCHIVGHSYGGLVALMLALANPTRVLSLTLIEPVFLAVIKNGGDKAAYHSFRELRDAFLSALARGDAEAAMRSFVGFWVGEGAWERMSAHVRDSVLQSAGKIGLEWQSAFAAETNLRDLAEFGPRTLLISGDDSPAPMHRLVEALHAAMPGSRRVVVSGAGHLLPVTHAADLTQALLGHFRESAMPPSSSPR